MILHLWRIRGGRESCCLKVVIQSSESPALPWCSHASMLECLNAICMIVFLWRFYIIMILWSAMLLAGFYLAFQSYSPSDLIPSCLYCLLLYEGIRKEHMLYYTTPYKKRLPSHTYKYHRFVSLSLSFKSSYLCFLLPSSWQYCLYLNLKQFLRKQQQTLLSLQFHLLLKWTGWDMLKSS